ncbi:hypothetical protein [Lysobacter enzymogenes]|uniref:hypothetical protein n=1 Tax=Lysobacter enzymogenes TaxID=69 RepID=UPI001115B71F|nr:hypothetical protein [Lysobacter enzymogenes]UZW59297.1 hypothetical protein BV903_018600 [Lysobacter enzymogenes]
MTALIAPFQPFDIMLPGSAACSDPILLMKGTCGLVAKLAARFMTMTPHPVDSILSGGNSMRLRRFAVLLALTFCPLSAVAHKISPGVYAEVPYNNNPFVFCTLGMPKDGWVAVNWRIGKWKPITQYPNLRWVPTYVRICPAAARPAGGGQPYRPSDQAATS